MGALKDASLRALSSAKDYGARAWAYLAPRLKALAEQTASLSRAATGWFVSASKWLASSLKKATLASGDFISAAGNAAYARLGEWARAFVSWSAGCGRVAFEWSIDSSKLLGRVSMALALRAVKKTGALINIAAFLFAASIVAAYVAATIIVASLATVFSTWAYLVRRRTVRLGAFSWRISARVSSLSIALLAETGAAFAASFTRALASGISDLSLLTWAVARSISRRTYSAARLGALTFVASTSAAAACLKEAAGVAARSLLLSLLWGGKDLLRASLESTELALRLVKGASALTLRTLAAARELTLALTVEGARLTARALRQTGLSLTRAATTGLGDIGRIAIGALTATASFAAYFAGEASLAAKAVAEEATEFGRALASLLSGIAAGTLRASKSLVVGTGRVVKGTASALYALTLGTGRALRGATSALYAIALGAGRGAREIATGLLTLASTLLRSIREGWTVESWKLVAETALVVITTTAMVHLYKEANFQELLGRATPVPALPEIIIELPPEEVREPVKEYVKEPAKVEKIPVVEKPKVEKKLTKKLPDAVVEKPRVEKPRVEKPKAEIPKIEKPGVEKPKPEVKKKVPEKKVLGKTVLKRTTPDKTITTKLKRPGGVTYPYQEISRGPLDRKEISITFDGGSNAAEAKLILKELRKRNIRTTIFLTGQFIKHFPLIVRQMVRDGHEIGNHMWNHPHLTNYGKDYRHSTLPDVTREFVKEQLFTTERAFRKVAGTKMAPIWRAPYGEVNKEIRRWAYALGYVHVGWTTDHERRESLDTLDWVDDKDSRLYRTSAEIKGRVLSFGKETNGLSGGIILMHLGTNRHEDKAASVLGEMMDDLMARGYRFVKVSDMMGSG